MALTKTPFFSLGAHGSVGESITAQERNVSTLIRRKPLPADPYTLPQAYQRWLYEDYAYLWTQQSEATKAEYRTAGSRFHLTGFQCWMKSMLTLMPDIIGWWTLDEGSGAIAHDRGRLSNNGTIFGASHSGGVINGGEYFDGLNDYILVPYDSSMDLVSELTIEAWVKTDNIAQAWQTILCKGWADNRALCSYMLVKNYNQFIFSYGFTSNNQEVYSGVGCVSNTWYHLMGVLSPTHLLFYLDGSLTTSAVRTNDPFTSTDPIRIGKMVLANWWLGNLDNIILYNRALDATEAKRHSERRYPA